ncbi:MAG: YihY/virulence factor BrkB family protein [Actinomycetota bacterium]
MASRPGRAWRRYSGARGNILAAGIGYFAFFSIFPAVALAFSVFGFVLREHPQLLSSILDQLGTYLPGLVKDAQHPDGLITAKAPESLALTITGVIAFVTLVLAGLGWLGAVREGIRAVFGARGSGGNLITNLARDLGVLFTLGLGIALVAVLTSGVGGAAGWLADRIGMSGDGWVLMLAGFTVSVLADTALMILLLRVVSGVPVAWHRLFQGALVGGVGLSLLKISAAVLLPRLTRNPLFASFAIVVGLLIWLNLIARLTLISAAWAANDVDETLPGDLLVQTPAPHQLPEAAGLPGARAARGAGLPTFGARSADRTAVGSGFILGAAAMGAAGVLARGLRLVARLGRR